MKHENNSSHQNHQIHQNHQSPLSFGANQRLVISLILSVCLWGAVYWALQSIN